ncbi:MAG: hypothetical protein ABI650_03440 [Dokdonella sp.]
MGLALSGACIVTNIAGASAPNAEPNHFGRGIVGTWQVKVSLHDCTSGVQIGMPFDSLLTFADGGTLTETTANAMFHPAVRSGGHGYRNRDSRSRYTAATLAYVTANGALTRIQKITRSIVMGPNPDEFSVPRADIRFFDPAGNPLMTGCASAVAVRFDG